jgi:hypothetical protein
VGCSLQGALAHAKNGDEVFWKEKFHAANGKAQTCTQRTLFFFLLCFGVGWGGGKKVFFHFSWLPNVFALCSFQVPNGFPIFSPTFSPYLLTFICLGKWCPPFTYIGGPKGRNCTVQNRAFCFGEFPLFFFFGVMGQSNWHVVQKKNLGGTSFN